MGKYPVYCEVGIGFLCIIYATLTKRESVK